MIKALQEEPNAYGRCVWIGVVLTISEDTKGELCPGNRSFLYNSSIGNSKKEG